VLRKTLLGLVLGALTLLAAVARTDIIRFWKIRRGRPQSVPASGRTAYPQRPGSGAADGTGDFDSASRGGPAASA
jgi:hypothetical protein